LIQKIDQLFAKDLEYYSSCLRSDRKGRFKIKLFTNGVTIGNDEISVSEVEKLGRFDHIKVDLLVSIKGVYEKAFCALQGDSSSGKGRFEHQVSCLEKLLSASKGNLDIQPVLGFYHSKHFNIKAPEIDAEDMFVFDGSPLSQRLYHVLKAYISNGNKFFVEPVHALGKAQKDIDKFYHEKCLYLERSDLIEAGLESNSKTDHQKTKLARLFRADD